MWAGTLARGINEKIWDVDVSYETDLAPILSDQAIRVFSELALEAICDLDCSRVGVFTTARNFRGDEDQRRHTPSGQP